MNSNGFDKLVPTNEGFVPTLDKGYQPVEGGFVPTSQGDNPSNSQPLLPPDSE